MHRINDQDRDRRVENKLKMEIRGKKIAHHIGDYYFKIFADEKPESETDHDSAAQKSRRSQTRKRLFLFFLAQDGIMQTICVAPRVTLVAGSQTPE